jgi:hypothetical protein
VPPMHATTAPPTTTAHAACGAPTTSAATTHAVATGTATRRSVRSGATITPAPAHGARRTGRRRCR